ncbi:hypothetical protein H4W81_006695 [Nonomuraea africana]|uniref:Uncharacterized protein n=1 Tax=Nonomuraea africana TaxID=46171 RepID=A0ABR9KPF8_9ACTN|nr:hypothetical protein [Nonomuraea africana]
MTAHSTAGTSITEPPVSATPSALASSAVSALRASPAARRTRASSASADSETELSRPR